MPDRVFAEPALAELYDAFCAGRPDFPFYLPLVMAANSVLDIGCGTGELLRLARRHGHTGRLCGLDPAAAMLDVARRHAPDVDWVLGDASKAAGLGAFDLVVMTGHAFQVFLDDAELRTSLGAIGSALGEAGRFVFETRNPAVRAWEHWTPENAVNIETPSGTVTQTGSITNVGGEFVSFTLTYTCPAWPQPIISESTLRFLDLPSLALALSNAGLAIDAQYGDWDASPLTETSPEIITIARPA